MSQDVINDPVDGMERMGQMSFDDLSDIAIIQVMEQQNIIDQIKMRGVSKRMNKLQLSAKNNLKAIELTILSTRYWLEVDSHTFRCENFRKVELAFRRIALSTRVDLIHIVVANESFGDVSRVFYELSNFDADRLVVKPLNPTHDQNLHQLNLFTLLHLAQNLRKISIEFFCPSLSVHDLCFLRKMTSSSLLIRCPFCDCLPLSTPELLVNHLAHFHNQSVRVEASQFGDRHSFEMWLNRVEESRQDSSSYIPNETNEEEEESTNPEYYLLCGHHSQDATKRRRVDRNGNFPLPAPILTCPAFVHVKHGDMGQVDVAYCLDHITSSDDRRAEMPQSTTSIGKKRGSSCMSMDCTPQQPLTSTPMDTVPSIITTQDVDFSPINEFISTKLDSTALKLKNLTKVLAQLAVDIGACEHRVQPVYA